MRCLACNSELTDHEATWKNRETGEFYDLCGECYGIVKETTLVTEQRIEYNGTKESEGPKQEA